MNQHPIASIKRGSPHSLHQPQLQRVINVNIMTISQFVMVTHIMLCALVFTSLSVAAQTANDVELTVNPVLLKVIQEVDVPAFQEGPVAEIQVSEGQVVQIGEPILQMDDQRARFRLQQAELELKIAKSKAENRSAVLVAEKEARVAQSSLQRALESRKRFPDSPSQAEVDDIELKLAQAQFHLAQAKHDFELAELARDLADKNVALANFEVDRHKIKAPIQGAVIEVIARKGEWVQPGQPLVRIMQVNRLKVEGFLKRESVHSGLLNRRVTIVLEGTDGEKGRYTGQIVFVSPVVDPNDRTQRVVAEVENPKGELGPGLRAKMLIHSR